MNRECVKCSRILQFGSWRLLAVAMATVFRLFSADVFAISVLPGNLCATNIMGGCSIAQTAIINNGAKSTSVIVEIRETERSIPETTTLKSLEIRDNADYVPGEILVRFSTNVVPDKHGRSAAIRAAGGSVIREFSLVPGLALVKKTFKKSNDGDMSSIRAAVKSFSEIPGVIYAEPNYIYHAYALPNDPMFSRQWGLYNNGQTGGMVNADISAAAAWERTTGSDSVIVGVIDSGIDYKHEDLASNMWVNASEIPGDGIDNDANGYIDDIFGLNSVLGNGDPMDDNGHGSHCAGIIGAVSDNGVGIAGVAWNVRLMALKFLDAEGSGNTANAIKCIEYGVAHGAKILSNSWGGSEMSESLKDAISAANTAGTLFVAAAGNDGSDNDVAPQYPSSYDCQNVISVAATDNKDRRAYWSCYGTTSVDIAAPGDSILSCRTGGGYVLKSGTSMAAPFVSGSAALLYSVNSGLTPASAKAILMQSGDLVDPLMSVSGRRLDIADALSFSPMWALCPDFGPIELASGDTNGCDVLMKAVDGMQPGTYYGEIIYSSSDAASATQSVTMVIVPDSLSIDMNEPVLEIKEGSTVSESPVFFASITNKSQETTLWTAAVNDLPLSVVPSTGELPADGNISLRIAVVPEAIGFAPGEYKGQLSVSNCVSGAIQAIPLALYIRNKPVLLYVDSVLGDDSASGLTPGESKQTIQAAIESSGAGDTILVAPGTYEGVNAVDLDITIRSLDGYTKTIITPSSGRCATLGRACTVLEGFTLSGGSASQGGGAYGGTLRNCLVTSNVAMEGGGVYGSVLENCVVALNEALENGGGAYSCVLNSCTVSKNKAGIVGGGVCISSATNSIIWGNTLAEASSNQFTTNTYKSPAIYSCLGPKQSGVGNICADPLFNDASAGDFSLRLGSPCANSGNNLYASLTNDIGGVARIQEDVIDMGAWETSPALNIPSAPTGISATDGTLCESVHIIWDRIPDAEKYSVYRTFAGSFTNAELIGVSSVERFDDTNAVPYTVYTYKVKSLNNVGYSTYSAPDTGWRSPPVEIATTELPIATREAVYNFETEAINGVYPYLWSLNVTNVLVEKRPISTFCNAPGNISSFIADGYQKQVILPFEFQFYGKKYNSVWISDDGVVFVGDNKYSSNTFNPSISKFKSATAIAPLWNDVFTGVSPSSGIDYGGAISYEITEKSLTVYWAGVFYTEAVACNFSMTLHSSGVIEFKYGTGNQLGGFVGISAGDNTHYTLIENTESGTMNFASDIVFTPDLLPRGLVLSENGIIDGIPKECGVFPIALTVSDSSGGENSKYYSFLSENSTDSVSDPDILSNGPTVFTNAPLVVSFRCDDSAASIYYTLDGSDPSVSGVCYNSEPVMIETTTVICAVAKAPGKIDSGTVTKNVYRVYDVRSALNSEGFEFETSGDSPWFSQVVETFDGVSAMQSGAVTHSQTSELKTIVTGPAYLDFYCKVSSEAEYDFLNVSVNDKICESISGVVDWTKKTLLIPAGESTVTWTYAKDKYISSYSDCGWIDCLTLRKENLIIDPDNHSYLWDAPGGFFCVESSGEWTATSDSNWIQLIVSSGSGSSQAAFQLLPNMSENARTGTVTVVSSGYEREFVVTQHSRSNLQEIGGTHYGLFVGVNEYEKRWCNELQGCVTDAVQMASHCISKGKWTIDNSIILLNSDAKKASVRSNLTAIAAQAVPGDTVLFFQSSHGGITDDADSFLCEYDNKGFYYDYELAEDLSEFASGVRVVIVVDACNSGGLFKSSAMNEPVQTEDSVSGSPAKFDMAGRVDALMRANIKIRQASAIATKGIRRPIDPSEIGWVTAADYDQYSWDNGILGGFFTLAVLEGWDEGYADRGIGAVVYGNNDGYASFYELWNYAKDVATGDGPEGSAYYTEAQCLNTNVLEAVIAGSYGDTSLPDCFSIPLSLETIGLSWTLGGDSNWFSQTNTTYDGADAMQSGSPADKSSSTLETTLVGSGSLSFQWKSSSEPDGDFVRLYVDGIGIASISGDTEWSECRVHVDGPGTHIVVWSYEKNKSNASGLDCGWLDSVKWVPDSFSTVSIEEALDIDNFEWVHNNSPWTGIMINNDTENDYAVSGVVGNNEESIVGTCLRGPGTISFSWSVSSEEFDMLEFYVNGSLIRWISGEQGWTSVSYTLGEGRYFLDWKYRKDESDSSGYDCGWLDQMRWTPGTTMTNTVTTPEQIPYDWLDQFSFAVGSYETAAMSDTDSDGYMAWQEYVCGSNPEDGDDFFRLYINVFNGIPQITWTPDLSDAGRVYTIEGTSDIRPDFAEWSAESNTLHRFFRVKVGLDSK